VRSVKAVRKRGVYGSGVPVACADGDGY